jgi:hypothetical protein
MDPHSVADPDPRSGAFLTPGPGIRDGKKVSIRIRKPFFWVKILKFFDADPGSRMETVGSGIRGKHTGSATLDPPRSFNAGEYWRNRIHNLV